MVVPTRNEARNVAPLVGRLARALRGTHAEVIFVDDSDDDTPTEIRRVAADAPLPVRVIHRAPGQRAGGLGAAVLVGLRSAAETGADWSVVMDGDLQHPPEVVPKLIASARLAAADVAVASRYVGSGSAAGLGAHGRHVASSGATRLTKAVFPRRLRECSDPMSGFFAVRLAALDLGRLRPQGFKILLEVLIRTERLRLVEQPFTFAARHSGDSKASWREGAILLRRLVGLRSATLFGRHRRRLLTATAFGAVGLSGMAVNSGALWALVSALGLPVLPAAALATQVSTAWNFLLTDQLVFRGAKDRPAWQRFTGFFLVNNVVLLLRLPALSWLVHATGMGYVSANILTLLAAFAVRFAVSDLFLFRTGGNMTITERPSTDTEASGRDAVRGATRSGPTDVVIDLRSTGTPVARASHTDLPWQYRIHGLVTVASAVRLKELDYFAAAAGADGPADIEIRPGHFGNRLRGRARVTQYAAVPAVSYEEHLGRLGSDFLVEMGDHIAVTVGPWLMRSPHVLYTNVVEALLRFVLVARGHVLLHSACLDVDGRGVLLSARTDTGKTGTVLRLLRDGGARFLSDDMTVVSPEGAAWCYPKPLTISHHTLRAVEVDSLTPREWRRLRLQSRLHSKEGRGIGARLGEMNLPIMSLNAVTQYVVPPPKYTVRRLVPCEEATAVRIEDLFIIERDEFRLDDIDPELLVDELLDNTDDAYGFPPFRYFAPALVVGGLGYDELRVRERSLLVRAMQGVRARRLATPDYSWADHIPRLAVTGNGD
ncbi:MAG TPA: GtrA family protein [Nocardioidaceae bacterium]|nr:GtrA family protein [Nocardioidaceae bacterium]